MNIKLQIIQNYKKTTSFFVRNLKLEDIHRELHLYCSDFPPILLLKGKQQTEASHNSQLLRRSQLIPGMAPPIEVPEHDGLAQASRLPSRALYPVAISQKKNQQKRKVVVPRGFGSTYCCRLLRTKVVPIRRRLVAQ